MEIYVLDLSVIDFAQFKNQDESLRRLITAVETNDLTVKNLSDYCVKDEISVNFQPNGRL